MRLGGNGSSEPGQAGLVGERDARRGHPRRQLRGDPRVVRRRVAERLDRESRPQAVGDMPAVADRVEDGVVARRRRHDRDVGVVLRGGPDHRGPADVDLLDELVERDAGPLGSRRERVEVDDDELERGDRGGDQLLAMVGEAAVGEDPGVDPRMERLHPAVEHLGEARHRGDVRDGEARLAEGSRGAAGRDELEAVPDEAPGERRQAGLVGDREEGAAWDGQRRVRRRRVDRDVPAVGRDIDRPGEEQRDRPRQQAMLDRLDPLVERRLVVARAGSRRPPGARSGRRRASRRRGGRSRRSRGRPRRARRGPRARPGTPAGATGGCSGSGRANASSTAGPTIRM